MTQGQTCYSIFVGLFYYIRDRIRSFRYVGYGMALDWKDGQVIVSSRLLKSPAGRAGVRIGARLIRYNDKPATFSSAAEFAKELGPRTFVGEEIKYLFDLGDGKFQEVTLKAEIIWGPIPVYRPINILPDDQWRFTRGLAYCKRTGQFFPTSRMSDEAFDRLFGN